MREGKRNEYQQGMDQPKKVLHAKTQASHSV
jgi:hypothetical protein